MPSPFPGMDPYFEGRYWSPLHNHLAVELARMLSQALPPRYVAITDYWYALSTNDEPRAKASPDVSVEIVRESAVQYDAGRSTSPTKRIHIPVRSRRRQTYIRIVDVENEALVTAIELISPANKYGDGYDDYLKKRSRLLGHGVNMVEVDLLHSGRRLPARENLPDTPYLAYVTRAEEAPATDIWAIALADRLPILLVPLAVDEDDVSMDLQAAFASVYDIYRFNLLLKYDRRPPVRLPDTELSWTRELLVSRGFDVTHWDTDEPAV